MFLIKVGSPLPIEVTVDSVFNIFIPLSSKVLEVLLFATALVFIMYGDILSALEPEPEAEEISLYF